MIENLTRKRIRYLMFRFRNEATGEAGKIRGPEAARLLQGWGIDTTRSKANGLLGDIKDAYENQSAFGGWDQFAGEYGVASAWDIGMHDTAATDRQNLALMISRPHKWFLFGIDKSLCVNTRIYREEVSTGLDYFELHGLTLSKKEVLERKMRYGIQDGRRRDPMYFENDEREFNYESIIHHAISEQLTHWNIEAQTKTTTTNQEAS